MTIHPDNPFPGTDPGLPASGGPCRLEAAGTGISREAVRRIGRNLRLLYADVLDQPLPERFAALLDTLAENPRAAPPAEVPFPTTDARGSS